MNVSANYSFEVEVSLSGTFQRGYPDTGPSFASAGEPGQPDTVEDIAIDDIGMVSWVPAKLDADGKIVTGGHRVTHSLLTRSLLGGVDRNSDAYRTICANILAMIGDEAEEALIEGASE